MEVPLLLGVGKPYKWTALNMICVALRMRCQMQLLILAARVQGYAVILQWFDIHS